MRVLIQRKYVAKDGTEFSTIGECEKYERVHLTKSDLDFMKDFMSQFLAHGELVLKLSKEEAEFYKESDKALSDACYADLKKAKVRMKKLAELQRKIKRMR